MTTNFSDDVHSLRAFHLKFIINANIVYIPVEATFSMSIVCANHYSQYCNWYIALCIVCWLTQLSSLIERTSDNQCLGTSNDTTSVTKHPKLKSQLNWSTDYSLDQFSGSINSGIWKCIGKQLRDVNVVLIAITRFDTIAFAKHI